MATPVPSLSDVDMAPVTKSSKPVRDVQYWSDRLRLEQSLVTRIENIEMPALFLERQHEAENAANIVEAYLTITSFTVKVWINYDSAENAFYIDDRTKTCGKLQISVPARVKVQNAGVAPVNVIFILATAWRDLCSVSIKLVKNPGDRLHHIRAQLDKMLIEDPHRELTDFVFGVIRNLNFVTMPDSALTIRDLDDLATYFVKLPDSGNQYWAPVEERWYDADWAQGQIRHSRDPLEDWKNAIGKTQKKLGAQRDEYRADEAKRSEARAKLQEELDGEQDVAWKKFVEGEQAFWEKAKQDKARQDKAEQDKAKQERDQAQAQQAMDQQAVEECYVETDFYYDNTDYCVDHDVCNEYDDDDDNNDHDDDDDDSDEGVVMIGRGLAYSTLRDRLSYP